MKLINALVTMFCIGSLIGCGSDSKDQDDGIIANQLNPCATKGATYLIHYVEISGNCGPLPDEVLNTNPSGSAGTASNPMVCDEMSQVGCTARNTNCRQQVTNECVLSQTLETTFLPDGSFANGIATIALSCDDGSWCKSTYKYTITRQDTNLCLCGPGKPTWCECSPGVEGKMYCNNDCVTYNKCIC